MKHKNGRKSGAMLEKVIENWSLKIGYLKLKTAAADLGFFNYK
jgi:hypothetical protein